MFLSHALRAVNNIYGGITLYSLPSATVDTQTSYSIRIPDNVNKIAAVAIGAGGAGGGCSSAATAAAGGGGGGALSYSNAIDVIPGETLTVLVPNQSAAGTSSGGNGSSGLTASIARGATILLSALGGSGSLGRTSSTASAGASGGAAASGVGSVKYSGGTGGAGVASTDQGGGGGGAAGYAGNGGVGGTAGGGAVTTPAGGGGGGGGSGSSTSIRTGSGGGVLWYGVGNSGTAGTTAGTPGGLGSSLGGNTSIYTTLPGANIDNSYCLPGGGGAGAPSGGTTAYFGMRGAGGAVRILWGQGTDINWGTAKKTAQNKLYLRSSASSATSTIVMPPVELGDTAIFIDYAENTSGAPTAVTPSGFTIRLDTTSGTRRLTTYYKRILSRAETDTSLTGANGTASNAKIIVIIAGRQGAGFGELGTDTSLNGSVGAAGTGATSSLTVSTADTYAKGVPVSFSFLNSTANITASAITTSGIPLETVTVPGPDAKTFLKLGFFPQESGGSYSTNSVFTTTSANNTYGLWEARFY